MTQNLRENAPEDLGYDLLYPFLRGAVRINNLLHLSATNSFFGRYPNPGSRFGVELAFVLTVAGAAAILLLLLRLSRRTSVYRAALGWAAGALALFALPACFLFVFRPATEPSGGSAERFLWSSFGAGVLGFGILFAVNHWRRLSAWPIAFLMLLHYAFWFAVLWSELPVPFYRFTLVSQGLLLFVFPLAGVAWLLYLRRPAASAPEAAVAPRAGKWTFASATCACVLLLIIWWPGRSYSLAHARDLNSLTVVMERGSCFGSCPVYSITIHGDGRVEYVGRRFVRDKEPQTTTISKEQLARLLQDLDGVHFYALEERAFTFCFDTPRVAISGAVDGRSKRVSSDAFCAGSKRGVQARFVSVAAEIDTLVGSERWVKCDGRCRP